MKLLMENWREFITEDEHKKLQDIIVTVDDDGNLNIPKSGDPTIDSFASDILATLKPEDLKPAYRKKLKKMKKCNKLSGQCFVATEVFWELMKMLDREDFYYVPCYIRHENEPHWYAKDIESGHIVDLTAGQFEEIPDYSLGKCDTKNKFLASRYMQRTKDPNDPEKRKTIPTKRTLSVLKRMGIPPESDDK